MALDVPTPDPPTVTDPQSRGQGDAFDGDAAEDYHRDELEALLADGAWAESFETWARKTDLTESEVALLVRHGLFDQLDFYWHPDDEAVRYRVPDLSDDAREALATDTDVDTVGSELDVLARLVSERLADDFADA